MEEEKEEKEEGRTGGRGWELEMVDNSRHRGHKVTCIRVQLSQPEHAANPSDFCQCVSLVSAHTLARISAQSGMPFIYARHRRHKVACIRVQMSQPEHAANPSDFCLCVSLVSAHTLARISAQSGV